MDAGRYRVALGIPRRGAARCALLGTMPNSAPPVFHESPVRGHELRPFDLIASNPPYIGRREASSLPAKSATTNPPPPSSRRRGYELYANLIAQSATHLKPGALLVLELGHNSLPPCSPSSTQQTGPTSA